MYNNNWKMKKNQILLYKEADQYLKVHVTTFTGFRVERGCEYFDRLVRWQRGRETRGLDWKSSEDLGVLPLVGVSGL
jgi:hypothetical protein